MNTPNFTIRASIAREHLLRRLAINAGVNPNSGIAPGECEALTLADEPEEGRADRLAYRRTFHDRAVSEIAGLMDVSSLRVWRAAPDGSMSMSAPLWAGQAFFEGAQSAEPLILDREEWERVLATNYPLTELGKMTEAVLSGRYQAYMPTDDIDPADGLPLDLDAELVRLANQREREAAEDAEAEAHLRAGDWMSTADALSLLMEQGSLREEAIGSLIMWLVGNDGQRPYLRARADHAIREFKGPHFKPAESKRDRIIHGWEWKAKFLQAGWGTGTFLLQEEEDGDFSAFRCELRLFGVRVSKDDLERRLRLGSSATGNDEVAAETPTASPPVSQPPSSKRMSPVSTEWQAWVAAFKENHVPLPDVDRSIYSAARQAFGSRVTQRMVREAFGGERPGPRN